MTTLINLAALCQEFGIDKDEVWPMVWEGCLPMPRGHFGTFRWKREEVEARLPKEQKGIIYFVKCGEYVKIGFTFVLAARLATLQTSNPHSLQTIGYICGSKEDEAAIHEKFAPFRHRGEWFYDATEIREFVAQTVVERQSIKTCS